MKSLDTINEAVKESCIIASQEHFQSCTAKINRVAHVESQHYGETHWCHPLQNNRGQTAIFVALIFQVLFVFFAMVINVGLLVHDKVNLQNSVDLAAYYAAGKQAEMLNAIAHSNYQIRQSWKLLAWRLRVIGDMGRDDHPLLNANIPLEEKPLNDRNRLPTVCVRHNRWTEVTLNSSSNENICKSENISIPRIPDIPVIAGFLSFNTAVSQFGKQQQQVFSTSCSEAGPASWEIAVRWIAAYRLDVGNRKKVIRQLADSLARRSEDFQDVTGASVFDGANQTFLRNLTRTNKDSASLELFNSLGGVKRTEWLNEIFVYPLVLYSDFSDSAGVGCKGEAKLAVRSDADSLPASFKNAAIKQKYDANDLLKSATGEPMYPPNPEQELSAYHSSTGVEKNPWFMAYVAVRATTKPRKPFAPFGSPVELVAKSYAKPFGGRIGPWAYAQWPREANRSRGGEPLDPLLPHSPDEGEKAVLNAQGIPNYSRFPGDELGLNSRLALGQFRNYILTQRPDRISRSFWGFLPGDLESPEGDIMAWTNLVPPDRNLQTPTPEPWIRKLEIAAVAPDLFDITYYSIDPQFHANYIAPSTNIFGEGLRPRADLGSREQDGLFFNVGLQIQSSLSFFDPSVNFYNIDKSDHLLTGWIPTGPYSYEGIPEDRFGHCDEKGKIVIPGGCAQGGRSGYSVKIVSKNYLTNSELMLGGPGITGGIRNPPPW